MQRTLLLSLACTQAACSLMMSDLSSRRADDDPPPIAASDDGDGSKDDAILDVTAADDGMDAGGDAAAPAAKAPVCKEQSPKVFSPTRVWQENDGTVAWTDLAAALAEGGGAAKATLEGTQRTNELWVGDFNASLPAQATVLGVVVAVRHENTSGVTFVAPTLNLSSRRLTKSTSQNLQGASSWFGSEDDLWDSGAIASSALADLAVSFSVQGGGGAISTKVVAIDGISVTVHFCVPE